MQPLTALGIGYNAPQNIQHYALYLESRIRAYRELKHDAVRVQAETNRDLRLNNSLEEDMAYTTAPPSKASSTAPQRSKTITGRKLRLMTVEKGLLRETKTVQDMIDSLVECRVSLGMTLNYCLTKHLYSVLSGRPGRRAYYHCFEDASQGSPHPISGR